MIVSKFSSYFFKKVICTNILYIYLCCKNCVKSVLKQIEDRNKNMSDSWSSHLEHDLVLFLRLLNHAHVAAHCASGASAGPHRKKKKKKINSPLVEPGLFLFLSVFSFLFFFFVFVSRRAPPSVVGSEYVTLLHRAAVNTTLDQWLSPLPLLIGVQR